MSLLTDLRAHLVADAGVSAITTRISLSRSNQSDALPRIVLHLISANHEHHMTAASGKVIGRVQVDCHARTPVAAGTLAEAVRQSLDGYRGLLNATTHVSMMHLADERTQYTPPHEGRDESGGVDTVQLDFSVGWTVSIPTFA